MKQQPGDIVYYREKHDGKTVTGWKCRLALEVKYVDKKSKKFTFTRSEYNLWISEVRNHHDDYTMEPHLFISVTNKAWCCFHGKDFSAPIWLRYTRRTHPMSFRKLDEARRTTRKR